jgi:fatty acid desaturase
MASGFARLLSAGLVVARVAVFVLLFISYNMFLHAEHHLFPAVPTAHLAELARRLDAVVPEIRAQQVMPSRGSGADSVDREWNRKGESDPANYGFEPTDA